MAKHKTKNPKARKEAARRMLLMAMKKKATMKGAVSGNGNADKVRPSPNMDDSGSPGEEMK